MLWIACLAYPLLGFNPDAAIASGCALVPLQSDPSPATSPERLAEDVELQRVLNEEPIAVELQTALGSQYASVWFENESVRFVVGLAPGPLDVHEASESLHEVLVRQVASESLLFAEARSEVRSVPYSVGALDSALATIRQELAAIGAQAVSTGLGGDEGPGGWPQVAVTFMSNSTNAECEAVISMLARYGQEVTYSRLTGVVGSADGEAPSGFGVTRMGTKSSTVTSSHADPPLVDVQSADTALRSVMHRLRGRGDGLMRARVNLTSPQTGRLAVKIWTLTRRGRKLAAFGDASFQLGDGKIVVPVERTTLGRRLRGGRLGRLIGEVWLLSSHGDAELARLNSSQ